MPYKDPDQHRAKQAEYARRRRERGVPPDATHGRRSTYDCGCRCPACRKANSARPSNSGRTSKREQLAQAWAEGRGHLIKIPHGHSGYIHWGCDCTVCTDAYRAYMKAKQDASLANAVNYGKPWDDFEIATVRRRDLTIQQTAQLLGRSFNAVRSARAKYGREPA